MISTHRQHLILVIIAVLSADVIRSSHAIRLGAQVGKHAIVALPTSKYANIASGGVRRRPCAKLRRSSWKRDVRRLLRRVSFSAAISVLVIICFSVFCG